MSGCGESGCGTYRSWLAGCRCADCEALIADTRERWRTATTRGVERLPVDLPGGAQHGEARGAQVYGCGCEPCCDASRAQDKARHRDRRKAPLQPTKETL